MSGRRLTRGDQDESLYEGVPDHLAAGLERWTDAHLRGQDEVALAIGSHLRIPLNPRRPAASLLTEAIEGGDGELWLDVIELRLRLGVPQSGRDARDQLENILSIGGSAWRVVKQEGWEPRGHLERRVDEIAIQAYETAVAEESDAAAHLSIAWASIYGRDPDPANAYTEAVRAIEAATKQLVVPERGIGTLGNVLYAMERQESGWRIAIEDNHEGNVAPVVAAMRMVWEGHAGRHGGPAPSAEAARAAVQTAVWIVTSFRDGLVFRVD